jgi:hypothetical protein
MSDRYLKALREWNAATWAELHATGPERLMWEWRRRFLFAELVLAARSEA